MSDHVDGNAVIGALSLALGTDVGGGSLECAGCGDTHEIAAHPRLPPVPRDGAALPRVRSRGGGHRRDQAPAHRHAERRRRAAHRAGGGARTRVTEADAP